MPASTKSGSSLNRREKSRGGGRAHHRRAARVPSWPAWPSRRCRAVSSTPSGVIAGGENALQCSHLGVQVSHAGRRAQ
jgi:hypothetical protein